MRLIGHSEEGSMDSGCICPASQKEHHTLQETPLRLAVVRSQEQHQSFPNRPGRTYTAAAPYTPHSAFHHLPPRPLKRGTTEDLRAELQRAAEGQTKPVNHREDSLHRSVLHSASSIPQTWAVVEKHCNV
ncbi:hypothetical protein J4Q44_G00140860 [Coregonus suidteri]|uniref:Uncharacterized protein n=1 Tax=Coregonus suidteri TaxID=861788 RepID=A0AAN8R5U9_9TELE